jgi:hypothetical protein
MKRILIYLTPKFIKNTIIETRIENLGFEYSIHLNSYLDSFSLRLRDRYDDDQIDFHEIECYSRALDRMRKLLRS